MPTQQVPITTPIKGVVRAVNREGQPPESCWDAQNVLPYDRYGRKRLAQRGGLKKQYPNRMAASFVQGMIEAPNIIYPPAALTIPLDPGLPGWPGSFSNTTAGPFAGPAVNQPFSVTLVWDFSLTMSVSGSNTGTDNTNYGSQVVFAFPFNSGNVAQTLIFTLIGAVGNSHTVDAGKFSYSAALYQGDPSNSFSWSALAGGTLDGVYGGTRSWDFTVQVSSAGAVALTNLTDGTHVNTTLGFSPLDIPSLNVQTVVANSVNDPPLSVYTVNLAFGGFGGF